MCKRIGDKKACDTNSIIVKHMYARNQLKELTAPCHVHTAETVLNSIEKAPDLLPHHHELASIHVA